MRLIKFLCLVPLFLILLACSPKPGTVAVDFGDDDDDTRSPLGTELSLQPAVSDGEYADVLERCAKARSRDESCSLSTLPFIAQELESRGQTQVSVDDIMSRVVVSHTWMADRFREILERSPQDLLQLFGSTTALVSAADVNPNFYQRFSGAVFIDPRHLWLTVEDKQTIVRQSSTGAIPSSGIRPTSLTGVSAGLNFAFINRSVLGNERALTLSSLDDDSERSVEDMFLIAVFVLFHELGHANDYYPSSHIASIPVSGSVIEMEVPTKISDELAAQQPLRSQQLKDVAQVAFFRGGTLSEAQRAVSAVDTGLAFEVDGAVTLYSYASIREDLATLFAVVMMKVHFDFDQDVGFFDVPNSAGGGLTCGDLVVRWGYRNRISVPLVRSRAEFVLQRILDRSDVSSYIDQLGAPVQLQNGVDWCVNLDPLAQ